MGTFFSKIKILGPKRKLREYFTEKENIWSEMAPEKEGEIKKQFTRMNICGPRVGKIRKKQTSKKEKINIFLSPLSLSL